MFEIYDMVYANENCTDPNLRGRVGLVFGVNRVRGLVHVAFDIMYYAVTVPEIWLYKAGILRQRDRNADMQCYLPGRFICAKDGSKLYDYIKYLHFNYIGGYEYNGRLSDLALYGVTVWTQSGKHFDADDIEGLAVYGDLQTKYYSNTAKVNQIEHIHLRETMPENVMNYCKNDVYFTEQVAKDLLNSIYGIHSKTLKEEIQMKTQSQSACNPIKKVIFNDPATIVFWNDGTKTVVQARGEAFDPEKGLAMAISRHYLCDICHLEEYRGLFEKHLKNYQKPKTGYGHDAATIIIDDYEDMKENACSFLNKRFILPL